MIKKSGYIFFLILLIGINISCKKDQDINVSPEGTADSVYKPSGIFSSSGATNPKILNHPEVRGVLVRTYWKDIEPIEGSFNFASLDNQINSIKASGKKYSLSVLAGGIGSPEWLITNKSVPFFDYSFRGNPQKLPLIWDSTVMRYLKDLAENLAKKYKNDTSLVLVYIPQMTANGVEGHLNGFVENDFIAAGYNEQKWIESSIQNARNFATAFDNKALAFEVHNLFDSSIPASSIINTLWNDNTLNKRVGAAMWWISGKETYQSNLISVLEDFEGDIYCQIINRSDNISSFPNGDFSMVFEQAKKISARYIEPCEYEFTISNWDSVLQDFNQYSDALGKY